MNISSESLDALVELLGKTEKILIFGHTNPDGDALGSSLGLRRLLDAQGKQVEVVMPNRLPSFLEWMPDADKITIYKEKPEAVTKLVEWAELIFCLDFNQISRLEGMAETIAMSSAPKVLIDHHIDPSTDFAVSFSHTESCSTCYLLLCIAERIFGTQAITKEVAELLYVGIMTDTGNFSFSHLTPELFRAVARLVEAGIVIPELNSKVYNNFSANRMELLGYALYSKMTVMAQQGVAFISLTEEELRRFKFKMGDSEGFVNYPLSIAGISMSAMFVENKDMIRISIRSRGELDVNIFARKYFNGGGHKNAAGGRSTDNMERTVERFRAAVKEYLSPKK